MNIDVFFMSVLFILGAAVGSFLNVCIVRMPRNKSIVTPGSHCCHCGSFLKWFDNIPLVSYIVLRGRCRRCGHGFSPRYLLIELLTGIVFLLAYRIYGWDMVLIPYLTLASALVVATFVDLEYRIIPDELSFWGIPAAFLFSIFIPGLHAASIQPLMLKIGWVIGFVFALLSLMLMIIETFRRKMAMTQDEKTLAFVVLGAVLFEAVLLLVAPVFGRYDVLVLSLVASIEGVIIGGGSLYLMGLAGAFFINKRVVTDIDLKTVSDDSQILFKELVASGYLNPAGDIQPSFAGIGGAGDMVLSSRWDADRAKVYELIVACNEGGVMGGGDIKLQAMIGAFLGWQVTLLTFFIAPFFGAFFGIIEKIRTKSSAIAYGPHIVMGAVVSLVWGDAIIRFILSGGFTY
jgi:prepilin signal peptidase PulO-like enzyme (type II secretory pathway)